MNINNHGFCNICQLKITPIGCDCKQYTFPELSPPFMNYKMVKADFIAKSKTARYLDISITNINETTKEVLEKIKYNSQWPILYEKMNLKASQFGWVPTMIFKSLLTNQIIIDLCDWTIGNLTIIDNVIVSIELSKMLRKGDQEEKELIRYWLKNGKVRMLRQHLWNYSNWEINNNKEWKLNPNYPNNDIETILPISEIPVVFFLNNSDETSDGYNLQQYFNYAEHTLKTIWNELDFTGAKVKSSASLSYNPKDQDKIITRLRKGIVATASNFVRKQEMANEYIQTVPNQVDKHLLVLEWIDKEIDTLMGIEAPNSKKSAQESDKQLGANNIHAYNLKKMEARIREYVLSRIFHIALEYEKKGNNNNKVELPDILKVKIKLEKETDTSGPTMNNGPTRPIN